MVVIGRIVEYSVCRREFDEVKNHCGYFEGCMWLCKAFGGFEHHFAFQATLKRSGLRTCELVD